MNNKCWKGFTSISNMITYNVCKSKYKLEWRIVALTNIGCHSMHWSNWWMWLTSKNIFHVSAYSPFITCHLAINNYCESNFSEHFFHPSHWYLNVRYSHLVLNVCNGWVHCFREMITFSREFNVIMEQSIFSKYEIAK